VEFFKTGVTIAYSGTAWQNYDEKALRGDANTACWL